MSSLTRQAALACGLSCFMAVGARAQSLTVSGSPGSLRISTASPGFAPDPRTDAGTTYSVKAQNKTKPVKITAALNSVMPAGMTLTVELAAPTGATSNGPVTLDATARDLVGNITNTTVLSRSITYVLTATPAAGVVTAQSRTVTFTLTAWP